MPYIVIAIFVAGFSIGGVVVHRFDQAEIASLQSAIDKINARSQLELSHAQARLEEATQNAEQLNRQIETEQAAHAKAIDNLYDRVVAAGRVYARRQNCNDSVSTGKRAGQSVETAGQSDFPSRLAEIVRRADETANYAQACWRFVSNRCGIAKN